VTASPDLARRVERPPDRVEPGPGGQQRILSVEPDRHGRHEGSDPARREPEVGLEQALEFQKRLVVKGDMTQLLERHAALPQAVTHGVPREAGVMFPASEALFLRRGDDLSVSQKAGGAVVVVGRDTQNVHGHGSA